jgi:type VI secretion system protein ImpE
LEVDVKAEELLEANELSAAIMALTQDVKKQPADTRLRTFLFELLCFAGEYERADRQLDVIGHQNESAGIGVEVYRQLLKADKARQRWFSDGLRPTFLLEAPSWIQYQVEAGNRSRAQQTEEAKALLQQATSKCSKLHGIVNGKPFADFRDSDDRLGPVLEVYLRENYVWLPCEQIKKITIPQPKQLRDLLWTPATIESGDGPSGEVYLPVLYVGSHGADNDQLRLGRITDWRGLGDGLAGGVGQKTFLVDDNELSLLEIREIEFQRA